MGRGLRQLPNLISAIRILLSVPIAVSLVQHRLPVTLWLFAAAAVSDAADGFLAKRFGWQTTLGGMLDPAADKLLLATVFVTLSVTGAVPVWLTAAVIARDCLIVLGAVSYRALIGRLEARPSVISKLNTLCQIVFILSVIAAQWAAWPPAWVVVSLGALVLVTVTLSGIDYVLAYGRRALRARGRQGPARSAKSRVT